MGRYLAVRAVQNEGAKVASSNEADCGTVAAVPPAVPSGQLLVAVVDNGVWQLALDVTWREAYDRLYSRYAGGAWRRMSLYTLDAKRGSELEDGRRVFMDGRPVPDPARS